jgi:hypothetical protein
MIVDVVGHPRTTVEKAISKASDQHEITTGWMRRDSSSNHPLNRFNIL